MHEQIISPEIFLAAIALGICTGSGAIYFMAKKSRAIWGKLGLSGLPVLFYLTHQLTLETKAQNLNPESAEAMMQFCLLLVFGAFVGLVAVWGNWIDAPSHNNRPYY